MASQVTFVIPVFNEEENLPRVFGDLATLRGLVSAITPEPKFLFVDDGSTDRTAELLSSSGRTDLEVISHSFNQGPGAAFRTAFNHLIGRGLGTQDLILTLEGDATSDPRVFPRMLQRLQEGDDLILASPYLYGGGFSEVTGFRLLISHVANGLFKLILNVHGLATMSCFLRIYRGSALLAIKARYAEIVATNGFECAAEVVLKAVRSGLAISEVPFHVDWSRRKGKSKMRILRTTWGYLKLFWRYSRSKALRGMWDENPDSHRSSPAVR